MRNLRMKTIIILLSFVLIGGNLSAQGGNRQCKMQGQKGTCMMSLDLTEDQTDKIKVLRLEHQKMMLEFKNNIRENKAKHQTLVTADKVDINAVNKNIDEFTNLKNKMLKARAAHRQGVRNLLTDEQRIIFDTQKGRKHKGNRQGRGRKNCGNMYGN